MSSGTSSGCVCSGIATFACSSSPSLAPRFPESARVAAWKQGVVLLLGPVPGIVVAFALGLQSELSPLARETAISLVSINGFNLLPMAGLDGARLLEHVLFSRRRWLAIGFQLCAGLAMVA